MDANAAGSISPIDVTMTTVASVACGMSAMSGARNMMTTDRRAAGHQRRHLGAGAGPGVDGGLRRAPARGHRAEQAPERVGRAERQQLLVRVRPPLPGSRERASRRDRLGEAHERDAERAGPQCRATDRCQGA